MRSESLPLNKINCIKKTVYIVEKKTIIEVRYFVVIVMYILYSISSYLFLLN